MVAEKGIEIDAAHWPVTIHRVGMMLGVDEMETYLRGLDGLFARGQRFASVVVVKKRGDMDRRIIGLNGEWMRRNEELVRRQWMGVAFVFPGDFFRFLLSTILMAAPHPVPYQVFGTTRDAVSWATFKLRAAGVEPPDTSRLELD